MRLLIEQDDGSTIEVKEIEGVSDASTTLIALCSMHLSAEDAKRVADALSGATGKRCVVLPPHIKKIIGV